MKQFKRISLMLSVLFLSIIFGACSNEDNENKTEAGITSTNYKITFNANGGTINIKTQNVEKGIKTTLMSATTLGLMRSGYSFTGWASESNSTEITYSDGESITLSENLTLYAVWKVIPAGNHTVTFNTNGGIAVEQQIIINGGKATQPATPTKNGCTFVGWYTNTDLTLSFSFDTEITENITLYAKWEEVANPSKMFMGFENVVNIDKGTTTAEISAKILGFTSDTTLKLNGGINAVMLKKILEAMGENDSVQIALDLSATTGITEWKDWFAGAGTLYAISLPSTVTQIQDKAFTDCKKLKSITIPCTIQSHPSIDAEDAEYINFTGTVDEWLNAPVINFSDKQTVCLNGVNIAEITEVLISDSVTTIRERAFSGFSKLKNIILPKNVKSIGNCAFYKCSELTSVTIPDSATSIGDYAFYKCSELTSVTIPEGVTSIGNSTFEECEKLTSITIPNSVASIGRYAFSCCGITNVSIPDGVTSINHHTFSGSALTSITIPISVTSIEYKAFEWCLNLKTVNYRGSKTQWEAIKIGSDNDRLSKIATKVYYYTGN